MYLHTMIIFSYFNFLILEFLDQVPNNTIERLNKNWVSERSLITHIHSQHFDSIPISITRQTEVSGVLSNVLDAKEMTKLCL